MTAICIACSRSVEDDESTGEGDNAFFICRPCSQTKVGLGMLMKTLRDHGFKPSRLLRWRFRLHGIHI